jgi:alpha-tubulin suppressor-like RCC1 family protein
MGKGSDGLPYPIDYFPSQLTTHISVGSNVVLLGVNHTQVWSWGENNDGALGAGKLKVLKEPTKILDFEENVKEEGDKCKLVQLDVSKSEHHIHCLVLTGN